jgi:hypothetical protein
LFLDGWDCLLHVSAITVIAIANNPNKFIIVVNLIMEIASRNQSVIWGQDSCTFCPHIYVAYIASWHVNCKADSQTPDACAYLKQDYLQ